MTVFSLPDENIFPDPSLADADGLLAVGGDLSSDRLINAYRNGIFPWYSENNPIIWWSPNPRMVLFPKYFKRTKNLRKLIDKEVFEIKFDNDFSGVIRECARIYRGNSDGTWIVDDIIRAYTKLHDLGIAHSVETYKNGVLVGGLYGLAIGKAFFGESMFHKVDNASKVALWHLVDRLLEWDFDLIDAQQETDHLKNMGAVAIGREKFLTLLKIAIAKEQLIKKWN
ncbi:MAG: leucyl/phenylalanyl-tRNA--protein transferase [Chlorobi bacterium]|nr:leucyl/phenylalanyl-tRNA--protein transferase [Chlorobiota bacterium]